MPSNDKPTQPDTSPESHWGTCDPESQPPRDAVLGLQRLVVESWTRLGDAATPEAVTKDLKARGFDVAPAEVARICAKAE